jgi:hypothetical protein
VPPEAEPAHESAVRTPPELAQLDASVAGKQYPPAVSQADVPVLLASMPASGMSGAPAPSCDVSDEPGQVVENGLAQPAKTESHCPA